ncbi:hypothetical protein GCM10010302_43290 [Streptomyces polychromogenes]|uniref:Secreted protein n=1 Tax=Streptomyces polychromogenes TaxID=67342 RepID=A0ABN0VH15_9ACTN
MALLTVLILVAVLSLIALLTLAPSAPARRNPFPGRRNRGTHRRAGTRRLSNIPRQHRFRHHAR